MGGKNNVAFVTGGGTGIGQGIATEFAKAGYDVAFSYCGSVEGAKKTEAEIRNYGVESFSVKADVSKTEDIEKMFAEVVNKFSRLDVFVNNAGITEKSDFLHTSPELFDRICSVDYKGAFFCIQNAAKVMIDKGIKGSIILISSNNAIAHFADVAVYASAKAAAEKMSRQYGIRVNTIEPGWTETGASRLDNKEDTYYKIPLKKWATVEEIGKTAVFLASDAAASITGTSILMDNGACLVSDKRERYGF